jgi:hypothetical protein
MTSILKRTFAVLGVAALTAAGVALTAAPAQALPGSVVFEEGNCAINTGDGTVDGLAFTVTNASTTDEALTYEVVINFNTVDQTITLEPGDSQRTVLELPEDESTTVQVRGNGGFFGGNLASVDCVGNYSPDVTGSIQSSCLLDTGGIIGEIPGVLLTADNSEGETVTEYSFTVGDVSLESGQLDAEEVRVRSTTLEEDVPTHVEVGSVDEEGDYRVLAEADITLNCIADTPVITSPTEGQVVIGSPTTITGTGTPGDEVAVGVYDRAVFEDIAGDAGDAARAVPVTVPSESGEGYLIFRTTVDADGEFTVETPLAVGEYVVFAIAAREASEDSNASISDISNIVMFSVAAAPVIPATPVVPAGASGSAGGKALAATGFEPMLPISIAGGLLLAGAAAFMLRRRTAE